MAKLPASNKTSSYGIKPYIKKGYYPAKLLKSEPFTDKDGVLKEGTYGHMMIFEFAIFKADPDTGAPIEPMTFKKDPETNVSECVVIPKFVYHEYKDKKTGEYRTAITPKSAITKLFQCLGWKFSEDGIDPDDYEGKWVEVNVDDYEYENEGEKLIGSTIKDINPYKGPEPNVTGEDPKPSEKPKKVEKQVKHEAVKDSEEIQKLKSKIVELEKLKNDGFLTAEGFQQGKESIEAQIEELEKK